MSSAKPQTEKKASAKKVELLFTVQVKPGEDPLTPGEHNLDADLADALIKDKLAK
ncbi:hypothetical protein CA267_001755 [Alteromonas pelagimontana]|uniref:Uncharacterized protein n=1 Tax=Alteromonas pelagimontana TaxID=1858656 RepID=A0A6M4M9G2_9ALTE|nr:hypothetical protein [Alteromonas pelagimontana]QJR79609.1 hypothetical protein CA267_001755 [Alteromonas pelagimontana]